MFHDLWPFQHIALDRKMIGFDFKGNPLRVIWTINATTEL